MNQYRFTRAKIDKSIIETQPYCQVWMSFALKNPDVEKKLEAFVNFTDRGKKTHYGLVPKNLDIIGFVNRFFSLKVNILRMWLSTLAVLEIFIELKRA